MTDFQRQFKSVFVRQVEIDGRTVIQFATCGDRLAEKKEEIDGCRNFTAGGGVANSYGIPVFLVEDAEKSPGKSSSVIDADYIREYDAGEVGAKAPNPGQAQFHPILLRNVGGKIEIGKHKDGAASRPDMIDGVADYSVAELEHCGVDPVVPLPV